MIFRTKFAQKGYFPSKAGQMGITIKFIIFEIFILMRQFCLFGPSLTKKDISSSKVKIGIFELVLVLNFILNRQL